MKIAEDDIFRFPTTRKLMTTAVLFGDSASFQNPDVCTTYYAADQYGPFILTSANSDLVQQLDTEDISDDVEMLDFFEQIGLESDADLNGALGYSQENFPEKAVRITITDIKDQKLSNIFDEIVEDHKSKIGS